MDSRFFTGLIDRAVEMPLIWMILWLGLAMLSIALLVLMQTRWGQSRPLRKCAVLSLLAHVLLACFATTVQIVSNVAGVPEPPTTHVMILGGEDSPADTAQAARPSKPWDPLTAGPVVEPAPDELVRSDSDSAITADRQTDPQSTRLPEEIAEAARAQHSTAATDRAMLDESIASLTDEVSTAEPIEAPAAQRQESLESILPPPMLQRTDISTPPAIEARRTEKTSPILLQHPSRWTQLADSPTPAPVDTTPLDMGQGAHGAGLPWKTVPSSVVRNHQPPKVYKNRLVPDRARVVDQHGGSRSTEAAVKAALRWLAAAQSPDGAWHAINHGAGLEKAVLGHDRRGAGAQADTGVTGLALLAMLGAGHTHTTGRYQETVRRGLSYLLQSQGADGNLSGEASLYAKMYCHGIATFAMSEAYAMTGDQRLERGVRDAVRYTLAAQHPATGGWRYQPGDPGDTSQLGWQLMALRSAELAGIEVPRETYARVSRFLQRVASGAQRGLAGYRPRAGPSRTMTAEALVCRQFLTGTPIGGIDDRRAGDEAAAYILQELPRGDRPNLYYWYYATLGLYQHHGTSWHRWNEALKLTLVKAQLTDGDEAGSWSPDTVWGGYGGRVYSTAMAALSLEVYYRYLPLYEETARRRARIK